MPQRVAAGVRKQAVLDEQQAHLPHPLPPAANDSALPSLLAS